MVKYSWGDYNVFFKADLKNKNKNACILPNM